MSLRSWRRGLAGVGGVGEVEVGEGRAGVQVLEELIEQSWTALPRGALL